jgi:hypothetical protein
VIIRATKFRIFSEPLVPNADPEDKPRIVDNSAFCTYERRRLSKRLVIRKPDIRCEFAADFITQAQASIEVGETRPNTAAGIALAVKVDFELRLENQPVGNQQIVGAFDAPGQASVITEVKGWLEFEEVWRQSFDSDCTPGASRIGIQIVTDSRLQVEVS